MNVELTRIETRIYHALQKKRGEVVPLERLRLLVNSQTSVKVHICRMRKKIKSGIINVYGEGYYMVKAEQTTRKRYSAPKNAN